MPTKSSTSASTERAFASYVHETGGLPDSVVLGFFVYFQISEDPAAGVELPYLEQQFQDLGLSERLLPPPNRPVDAFKKATRDAEAKGGTRGGDHLVLPDGRKMNLLVRNLTSNKDKVVRALVRELVDEHDARLDYATVGEAVFYHAEYDKDGKRKPTGHRLRVAIDYDKLEPVEQVRMEAVKEKITASFEHDCRYIDGMKLRDMVRKYVLFLNAVQLKPGVYFVHKSRAEEMRQLIELCDRLKNGSKMVAHPMVDLPVMREEILEKFEAETETKVEALCDDIATAMTQQTRVTPDTVDRFDNKLRSMAGKATEYTRTLGLAQERTAILLELAMNALDKLKLKAIEDEEKALAAKAANNGSAK